MDADTLVRAIRAALDETERIARAATCEAWAVRADSFDSIEVVTAATHARWVGDNNPEPLQVVTHGDFHEAVSAEDGEHIAHNDPAAVLRRVAADRRVLERHLPELGIQRAYYCRRCHVPVGDPQWPCDEIRDLADRLDINPETETP